MDPRPDEALPERIRQGVAALRAGDPERAVGWLRPVATDREFAAAADLADLRARVLSLLGQAELERGRPDLAERPLRDAAILAKGIGDDEGLAEIRALQARVVAAATAAHGDVAERRRVARTPIDALLAAAPTPAARAAAYTAKANAEADAGHDGRPLAESAVAEAIAAGDARELVLARLTLARVAPDRAEVELRAAWEIAAAAGEFALVGAVGRAAELAGVTIGVQLGPDLPREVP